MMRVRTSVVAVAAVVSGLVAAVSTAGAPVAGAEVPPMTGSVSCTLGADSTFSPALGYQRGLVGPRVSDHADSRWKVVGELTGCSGTQTGGNPHRPGPITRGEVLVRARAVEHGCYSLTVHGMTVTVMRIRWFDALDRALMTTRATGSAAVAGLSDGWPWITFFPPVWEPGLVMPGVITFTVAGTGLTNSRSFPGQSIAMTAVADQTLSTFPMPCSRAGAYPPISLGLPSFAFHGTNGASTLSVG